MGISSITRLDGLALLSAIAIPARGFKGQRQRDNIAAFSGQLPEIVALADSTTPLRLAHMLAQAFHEADGLCTTVEYGSGAAYEGRADLGNALAGDGRRFKGRGLIQVTGRANYTLFSAWMASRAAIDFVAAPASVEAWPWAAYTLAWYWSAHKLNALADRDDLIGITRKINGGTNGLAERRAYLARAKAAVAALEAQGVPADPRLPTLKRGDDGDGVEHLQRCLRDHGYAVTIDGDFGSTTQRAVMALQAAHGLTQDGIVGAATWAVLVS